MQEERRRFDRYPFPKDTGLIEARIIWSSASDVDPLDIEFVDVSCAGLGIVSRNVFQVGDSMKLAIAPPKATPIDVVAVVCNRRLDQPTQSSMPIYRYGLYFECDAKPGDPACEEALQLLEEEVKRLHFQPV